MSKKASENIIHIGCQVHFLALGDIRVTSKTDYFSTLTCVSWDAITASQSF